MRSSGRYRALRHATTADAPHPLPFADLVLWDSRTVHCNTPALTQAHFFSLPEEEQRQQAAAQPRDLIRLCSYVCMLPRSHATPEELQRKVVMFSNRCKMPFHVPSLPSNTPIPPTVQLPLLPLARPLLLHARGESLI